MERTVYTCDLCKQESTKPMRRGNLWVNIMYGQSAFHTKQTTIEEYHNTCDSCMGIVVQEVFAAFDEVTSRLMKE